MINPNILYYEVGNKVYRTTGKFSVYLVKIRYIRKLELIDFFEPINFPHTLHMDYAIGKIPDCTQYVSRKILL